MGLRSTLRDRLEEWIYRLNAENNWIFRLYDLGNELWARLTFRGVRRRAQALGVRVLAGDVEAHVRFLMPSDVDAFADLLAALDSQHLPPHPLDRAAGKRALVRESYIPLGIWTGSELIGYILLRLFFFRRAVTGIWMLTHTHSGGIGRHTLLESVKFLQREGLPNYCTIPIGNEPSLRIAHWCGWRVIRVNRFFHVLKVVAPPGESRTATGS